MKKIILKVLMALGGLLLVIIGIAAWTLAPKLRNMKSEYVTADVIRNTDIFITEHHGQWPRS